MDLISDIAANSTIEFLGELLQRMPDSSEKSIENAIVERLKRENMQPRQQVTTGAGIMDIVTSDTIYEVKAILSRESIFRAIGQLMLYKESSAECYEKMVIIGVPGDGMVLEPFVTKTGIELQTFPDYMPMRYTLEALISIIENRDHLLDDPYLETDKVIHVLDIGLTLLNLMLEEKKKESR